MQAFLPMCFRVHHESIITLKEQTEVDGMISFIKDMSDIIDEKEEIFGIFSQHPQKLMIFPGLNPILSKFIGKVETLKSPPRITCHTPMVKNKSTNKKRKLSEACEDSLSRDTIETYTKTMCLDKKS